MIIFVASLIFALDRAMYSLNFFGLSALATPCTIARLIQHPANSLLVTLMRWVTAFLTSATFLFVYLVFFWTVIGKTPGKMILGPARCPVRTADGAVSKERSSVPLGTMFR